MKRIGEFLCESAHGKPRDNIELPTQNHFVPCMKYYYVKYRM